MDSEPNYESRTDENVETPVSPDDAAASKEEVIEALENAYKDNRNFQTDLLDYTLKTIRYYFFCDQIYEQTADDVLQIVIEKILNCKRKWYKQRIPDFLNFIMMVIYSYVRNERKKKDEFRTVDIYDNEGNLIEFDIIDLIRESSREDLADNIFKEGLEESIEKLQKYLEKDINAYFVLDELLNGVKENCEIAKNLCIDEHEVETARRRIKEKIKKMFKNK